MNIIYHGHSCFSFVTKNKQTNQEVIVVTDPYDNTIGLRLPKLNADIVTVSHDHNDHNDVVRVGGNLEDNPLVFNLPGEFEAKGIFLYSIPTYHDKKEGEERGDNFIYRFDIEGMSIAHMGDFGQKKINEEQLEKLGDIDILLVPVGGKYTTNADEAANLIKEIDPRIVIPMHYKMAGSKLDIESVDNFKKKFGAKVEDVSKLKIKRKDLPEEDLRIIILEKN